MGRERRESQNRREVVAVGLTGGIGAGKSTALTLFEEAGALTISADRLVHEFYLRPAVAERIGAHFGSVVLDDLGTVDRSCLARAVRGRPDELRWLEDLTHPWVAVEIERAVEAAPAGTVVVCEVPLLFETDYERLFDLVVTVEAGGRIRRLRSTHDFGLEQFSEFESLQASSRRRVEGSDLAFFNEGGLEELAQFVRDAYERARALLQRSR
jgi:dephospho-CoA kinase